LKYGREASLAWPLGRLLAETVRLWGPADPTEVVVPVPMPFAHRMRRGFNQAELLAREVGRILGLPVRAAALARTSGAPAQAGLSRTARLRTPRGSVRRRRFARPFRGRRVLLIDDVMTTGATASETARVLKADGARTVNVGVVARA
jgi:ComF family protein